MSLKRRDKTAAVTLMDVVVDIVGQVRRLKSENQIALNGVLRSLRIYSADKDLLAKIGVQAPLIMGVTRAQGLDTTNEETDKARLDQEGQEWVAHLKV